MAERFSEAEMQCLAAKAVNRIDLLGSRGTTLCTMEEIEAMAALLVSRGALLPPDELHRLSGTASTPPSTGDENV